MPTSPDPIPAALELTPPRDLTLTELTKYNAELRAELTTVTDVLCSLLVLMIHTSPTPIRTTAAKALIAQLAAFRVEGKT